MLPAFLAKLHPRHRTPVNAILLMGALSSLAPLLGRQAMVWLVVAGGLGIVIAYLFVAISFLVLRRKEPELERPFKVSHPRLVGWLAVVLSLGLIGLYLPGSPSALSPIEWGLFAGWMGAGLCLYLWSRRRYGTAYSQRQMRREWEGT